jgi:hypothetical protein
MRAEVVEHHYVAASESRAKHPLQVSENLLPQVEGIGFQGAAGYSGTLPALKRKPL